MKEYLESKDKVLGELSSSEESGLTAAEASSRLSQYGPNELEKEEKTPLWKRFFEQMADPMVIMLIVAAVISAVTGMVQGEPEWADVIIIMAVVIINSVLGVVQEAKSEQALEALDRDETAQAVEAGTQARQHWQRHRRFLCAVLSHDELDGIEQGFAELQAYSAVGDAAELRSRCEVLLLQLQHIAQLDAPYAENFLTCPVRI